jgi:hypothetical protein
MDLRAYDEDRLSPDARTGEPLLRAECVTKIAFTRRIGETRAEADFRLGRTLREIVTIINDEIKARGIVGEMEITNERIRRIPT